MSVKIVPHKRYLFPRPGQKMEYWKLCESFSPKEAFSKSGEVEAKCNYCKNAEYHIGTECIDKMGGCICLAGKDPRDNGEHKAKLRKRP